MGNKKGTRQAQAIFKRPDTGSWGYSLELGRDPDTGKRRQKKRSGFRTRREALAALESEKVDRDRGEHLEESRVTVGEFFRDWLASLPARELAGTTIDLYQSLYRTHIKPRLGSRRVQDLTPGTLSAFFGELRESGRRDGNGGLSAKSVQNIRGLLHTALDDAVTEGILARNPVAAVKMRKTAKTKRSKVKVWQQAELGRFLDHVERLEDDHDDGPLQAAGRLSPLWTLLAATGLRRSEALGLQWSDLRDGCINVERARTTYSGKIRIGPTKTGATRLVKLDPATLAVLDRWRARHEREAKAWAEATGDTSEWNPDGWLFVTEDGQPIDPSAVSRWFKRAVESAKVPNIGVHGLRHTHASLLLHAGETFVTVASRLGHAQVSTTMDTYSHLIDAGAESAAMRAGEIVHERPRLRAV